MKLTDQNKVLLVVGICLFGLVVVLKNILYVPENILTRDVLIILEVIT